MGWRRVMGMERGSPSSAGLVVAVGLGVGFSGCGSEPVEPESGNAPPEFTTQPVTRTAHNNQWSYTVGATDPDGDSVSLDWITVPGWVTVETPNRISGRAEWENVGTHSVVIEATDGQAVTRQSFVLTVEKGEIECRAGWVAPAESEYILPYREGLEYNVGQSYCSSFSHHNWFAYDIDTQIGDTLLASRGGVVIFTRSSGIDNAQLPNDQNFIFIEHDDGTVMWYVHLMQNGVLVRVGDTVAQGQPIALSGNTGQTAWPHVHVVLSRDRTDFNRQASLPVSYSNAIGTFDNNGGLRVGESYLAGPR